MQDLAPSAQRITVLAVNDFSSAVAVAGAHCSYPVIDSDPPLASCELRRDSKKFARRPSVSPPAIESFSPR